jgi:Fic family protein
MRTRYVDIDDRTQDLRERMRGDTGIADDFLKKYELSWLYHENALEGVVYSSQELEVALSSVQPLAEASYLAALREIRNHRTAMDVVREEAGSKKPRFNMSLVKRLYETLGAGVEGRSVAEFRKDMPLHRAYFHEIAQPPKIPALLQQLLESTESADFRAAHPVQRASKLQHGFMQVYPYTDNSGRVARLLANLVLLQSGYLPCIIHATDRQRYYESFRHPESALRDLMLDGMENALAQAEKYFDEAIASRRKAAR